MNAGRGEVDGEIDRAGQSGNRGPTSKRWRELDATRVREPWSDGRSRHLGTLVRCKRSRRSRIWGAYQGISRRIV